MGGRPLVDKPKCRESGGIFGGAGASTLPGEGHLPGAGAFRVTRLWVPPTQRAAQVRVTRTKREIAWCVCVCAVVRGCRGPDNRT